MRGHTHLLQLLHRILPANFGQLAPAIAATAMLTGLRGHEIFSWLAMDPAFVHIWQPGLCEPQPTLAT